MNGFDLYIFYKVKKGHLLTHQAEERVTCGPLIDYEIYD